MVIILKIDKVLFYFSESNATRLKKMKNLIQTWKICLFRDHFLKIQMMPPFVNPKQGEYENCKQSLPIRFILFYNQGIKSLDIIILDCNNYIFRQFRFKYITNRVSTVSQNIVASAEQELPPAFKMRSPSVTAYSSTDDGKN